MKRLSATLLFSAFLSFGFAGAAFAAFPNCSTGPNWTVAQVNAELAAQQAAGRTLTQIWDAAKVACISADTFIDAVLASFPNTEQGRRDARQALVGAGFVFGEIDRGFGRTVLLGTGLTGSGGHVRSGS